MAKASTIGNTAPQTWATRVVRVGVWLIAQALRVGVCIQTAPCSGLRLGRDRAALIDRDLGDVRLESSRYVLVPQPGHGVLG